MKLKIKRKAIATMVIDQGTQPNHMYEPIITWYIDFEEKDKPVLIVFKYAWQDKELRYKLTDKMKQILSGDIIKTSLSLFKEEYGHSYKGQMILTDPQNDYHLYEFGQMLPANKFDTKKMHKYYQEKYDELNK